MSENVVDRYPVEKLDEAWEDCGTMPENVDELRTAVLGRRIVAATRKPVPTQWYGNQEALVLELDNGTEVRLVDTDDCCAYTALRSFFLDPKSVDHAILGVGTTDKYETWHIYADFGDVMRLDVGWSCGNPFYYGYGFDITVAPMTVDGAVEMRELES